MPKQSNYKHLSPIVIDYKQDTFFTMGGARSMDVWDGILDPDEPGFELKYWALRRRQAVFRVKHLSWWEQELPSDEEYAEARRNLERVRYEVDYIITHCAPNSVQDELSGGKYLHDKLTGFLEEMRNADGAPDFSHRCQQRVPLLGGGAAGQKRRE